MLSAYAGLVGAIAVLTYFVLNVPPLTVISVCVLFSLAFHLLATISDSHHYDPMRGHETHGDDGATRESAQTRSQYFPDVIEARRLSRVLANPTMPSTPSSHSRASFLATLSQDVLPNTQSDRNLKIRAPSPSATGSSSTLGLPPTHQNAEPTFQKLFAWDEEEKENEGEGAEVKVTT